MRKITWQVRNSANWDVWSDRFPLILTMKRNRNSPPPFSKASLNYFPGIITSNVCFYHFCSISAEAIHQNQLQKWYKSNSGSTQEWQMQILKATKEPFKEGLIDLWWLDISSQPNSQKIDGLFFSLSTQSYISPNDVIFMGALILTSEDIKTQP